VAGIDNVAIATTRFRRDYRRLDDPNGFDRGEHQRICLR